MSRRTGGAAIARGAGLVAVGMTAMNAAAYGFTLVAARTLGPSGYSAVAALMGIVLVANVVALGVQTTTARRVAVGGAGADAATLLATGRRAALLVGTLCLLLSPVAALVFHLDTWLSAAMVAMTTGALTVTGAQLGLLQGGGRWRDFAVLSVASGAGRLVLGAAGILVSPTPLGAMSGVALGAVVPVLVGHRLAHVARSGAGPAEPWRDVGREVMHASHTLLAFFALTQADVFVARAVLPATESGLYAAGLIITKAVLFLPTFVTVMAFPALSRRGGRRHLHHLGLLLVLAIGLVAVAGVLLLPGLALAFVGGPAYAQVQPYLWLFAVLGTLGAMLQLLVQTALARRHRWAVAWVWLALGSVVAAAPFVGSGRQLLLVVLTVAVALLAALVVVTWSDEVQADPDSGVPGADTGTPRPATASGTSAGPTADPGPVSAPRRARSDRPPR